MLLTFEPKVTRNFTAGLSSKVRSSAQLSLDRQPSHSKWIASYKSSPPKLFCKKGVFKNFTHFTRKHPCQSLFVNKKSSSFLLKKRLWHRCFPVNFAKFLRTPISIEHIWWLLLLIYFCQMSLYFCVYGNLKYFYHIGNMLF